MSFLFYTSTPTWRGSISLSIHPHFTVILRPSGGARGAAVPSRLLCRHRLADLSQPVQSLWEMAASVNQCQQSGHRWGEGEKNSEQWLIWYQSMCQNVSEMITSTENSTALAGLEYTWIPALYKRSFTRSWACVTLKKKKASCMTRFYRNLNSKPRL